MTSVYLSQSQWCRAVSLALAFRARLFVVEACSVCGVELLVSAQYIPVWPTKNILEHPERHFPVIDIQKAHYEYILSECISRVTRVCKDKNELGVL